jgi:hypothetical protein
MDKTILENEVMIEVILTFVLLQQKIISYTFLKDISEAEV